MTKRATSGDQSQPSALKGNACHAKEKSRACMSCVCDKVVCGREVCERVACDKVVCIRVVCDNVVCVCNI